MAEAQFRHEAGEVFEVSSVGTHPAQVRMEAVAVMRELDMDISSPRSKPRSEFAGQKFDFVITVCYEAREEYPLFPGAPERFHWPSEDPAAFTEPGEGRLPAFHK